MRQKTGIALTMREFLGHIKTISAGLFLAVCIFFSITPTSTAAQDPKPYTATTVDECIHEKECVWYLFINHGFKTMLKYPFVSWKQPANYGFVGGEPGLELSKQFIKHTYFLLPYFPYEIEVGKSINTIVIFTDNTEIALKETYYQSLSSVYSDELLNKIYNKHKDEDCFAVRIPDLESGTEIKTALVVINHNSQVLDTCIKAMAYNVLAGGALINSSFSILDVSNFNGTQRGEITRLDKFFLHLIYHPEFNQAATLKELPKEFQKIYPIALKSFLELEKDNEHTY